MRLQGIYSSSAVYTKVYTAYIGVRSSTYETQSDGYFALEYSYVIAGKIGVKISCGTLGPAPRCKLLPVYESTHRRYTHIVCEIYNINIQTCTVCYTHYNTEVCI
jgi:hypothetical protein